MKSVMTHVLGTMLAGATASVIPTTAYAGHHDINLDIDIAAPHRHVDPPVCEDRPVQVWVEPVYQTVCDRHWVEPVYQTVTERVWCPPVTKNECVRVWVPERYEDHRVRRMTPYGVIFSTERVCIPGHYEDQTRQVVITPGHYDDIQRQQLVCDGHWETSDRQVLVTPGHYETHIQRVEVQRSHIEERPVGRIGVRLPLP